MGPVGGTLQLALGGPGGPQQSLQLQQADDIGVLARPELGVAAVIEGLVAGCHDDGPEVLCEDLVLLLPIYGASGAELLTDAARRQLLALLGGLQVLHVPAVGHVDDGLVGHCLGEGDRDDLPVAEARIELRRYRVRALLPADAAAGALGLVHVAGLLAYLHLEVAHEAADGHDLGICQQGYQRMLVRLHHPGRQDTRRAVQGWEGLVQLGHAPADGRLFLYQDDLVPGIGDIQRRLNAGDAAPDDQGPLGQADLSGGEGLVQQGLGHRHAGQVYGLLRGGFLVVPVDPAVLLPDVSNLQHIGVEAGVAHGLAEGVLVHAWRAGGDNHPVEPVLLDGLADAPLAHLGAHVLALFHQDHLGDVLDRLPYLGDVDHARDIGAAVAEEDAYTRHGLSLSP